MEIRLQKRDTTETITNLILANYKLNDELCSKNFRIRNRINYLLQLKNSANDHVIVAIIEGEINWLKELADI